MVNIELDKIYLGDCLIESDKIESGSVDLILTDLPYGTMKGRDYSIQPNQKEGSKTKLDHNWDNKICTKSIMEIANRILRKNGKMILFAQQPFTTELINNALPNLPHSYNIIWEKTDFANCLLINKACANFYEDILIFSKMNPIHDCEFTHPLRPYFKMILDFIGLPKKHIIDKIGQKADHTFRVNSSQYGLCTEQTYNELIEVFKINEMEGFKEFSELNIIDVPFKSNLNAEINNIYPSTFNLWQGNKYKSNILKYKKDYNGYHPTQKPLLLLEDLIKTFSNENNTVVDLTMGSGSTIVACINTNRRYLGFELDTGYFNIAKQRIKATSVKIAGI